MTSGGDFLSGFSGGNTQKPLTEQNKPPVKDEKPTGVETKITEKATTNVAENKKIADRIVAEAEAKSASKPLVTTVATRPAQNASAIIKAPEHVVTRDKSYNKRTIIKYTVIGLVTVAIAVIAFLIFRMVTNTEVPDFVGQELRQAELWDIQGGATVIVRHEYSIEYNEGLIFEQDIEPGEIIPRSSVLRVTVSRGPNMNEIIDLPDFTEMTRGQINTWSNANRMRSVTIRDEASLEVEQHRVIRVEFPAAVDPDNFRRSDTVTIFVSSGAATVQLPDFVGDDLEDVEEFITDNPAINLVIEHEEHETIAAGIIIRQTPARGTRVSAGDTVTIVISKGDPIIVPNWGGIRRIEAENQDSGLNFRVLDRYSASVPLGRFISQSVPAGTQLFAGHEQIDVIYSLGQPWIPNLVDRLENEIDQMILDFNEQGAFLTREIRGWDSWEPRGTIIHQNIYHQFAALNANLIFYISRGNLERPVDPPEPDEPPADVITIECDPGVEHNGFVTFPLTVMLNWQVVSHIHGVSMSTSRPAWVSSLDFTQLTVNLEAVNQMSPSITIHLLQNGRSVAQATCTVPGLPLD